MNNHTPGPWTALRCEHGWHVGPQPAGVCSIADNSDGSDHERKEANASLIAAAPDLLGVLERALSTEIIDQTERVINERHGGDCTITEAVEIALDLAGGRAAVAKATGVSE